MCRQGPLYSCKRRKLRARNQDTHNGNAAPRVCGEDGMKGHRCGVSAWPPCAGQRVLGKPERRPPGRRGGGCLHRCREKDGPGQEPPRRSRKRSGPFCGEGRKEGLRRQVGRGGQRPIARGASDCGRAGEWACGAGVGAGRASVKGRRAGRGGKDFLAAARSGQRKGRPRPSTHSETRTAAVRRAASGAGQDPHVRHSAKEQSYMCL